MIPVQFKGANCILAQGQDEYEPIAVFKFQDETGRVVGCFRLSDTEVAEIVATRTIWLQQLTFHRPFAPIALSTQRPADMPAE